MKKISFEKKMIYCILLFEVLYLLIMVFSRSSFLNGYFLNDYFDSEMDFFNMLSLAGREDPYCELSNYPASCFLILKVFHRMIPAELAYTNEIFDGKYLRNYMPVQIIYTLFIIGIVLITVEVIKVMTTSTNKNLLAYAMILSGPMIFAIERGNLILISFVCSLIYIALYDNENKYIRIISYIFLAIASSVKIYPAVLGILTMLKKRYKETIVLLLLGIVFFVLPFFYFEGLITINKMFEGLTASGNLQGNYGCGYNYSISNVLKILCLFLKIELNEKIIIFVKFVSVLLCFIMSILSKETWEKVFFLVMIMIWMPEFSYTYSLIFLIIPFVLLFNKVSKNRMDKLILINMGATLIPYALPELKEIDVQNAKLPLTMPTVIINIFLILIFVFLVIDKFKNIKVKIFLD